MRSRLTGREKAARHEQHDAETAYTGAILAILGLALLIITRIADFVHMGAAAPANWAFQYSPLFFWTIPLLLNAGLLCPVVLARAARAKRGKPTPEESSKVGKATAIAIVLMLATIAYLIAVAVT